MDKLKHIENTLEKFYAGNSSLAEEKELEVFFKQESVPEHLKQDQELFFSMAASSEDVDIPLDLKEKIIESLDQAEKSESRVRRINLYSISGLAAGLLIILSVYLGFIRENSLDVADQYAIEDPDLAYLEAKRALEFISVYWNNGSSELQNLEQVNKGMKTISPIQKISSGSRELNLLGNLKKAENIKIQ
ncbi:MAG: hypothetical protein PF450_12610 [Bacteroidales bacterium]|nr:hypothetical protein [Bacteroidales bacterium]